MTPPAWTTCVARTVCAFATTPFFVDQKAAEAGALMAKSKSKIGKSRRTAGNSFVGRWRITWMEQWDQAFVDEEAEGFFEFEKEDLGSFQFGYVRGQIDYRLSTRDGRPHLDFSWDGNDEMDPAQGRGWGTMDDGQLTGMLFFHRGDESKFTAIRLASTRRPPRKEVR
jgi:hypothetical protein